MNIVLVEPQIPQNTGNIARLCAATRTTLHLVGKLGFKTDDKSLKRAGLDYWNLVDVIHYDCFDVFEEKCRSRGEFYLLTTKGRTFYNERSFNHHDFLIFGSETKGLADEIRERFKKNCLRIPMVTEARSLNLANAASIVLYEALRQDNFSSCLPSL